VRCSNRQQYELCVNYIFEGTKNAIDLITNYDIIHIDSIVCAIHDFSNRLSAPYHSVRFVPLHLLLLFLSAILHSFLVQPHP